jgi:hypothetical protein
VVEDHRATVWDVGDDLDASHVTVRRAVVGSDGLAAVIARLAGSCSGAPATTTDVVVALDGVAGTHQVLDRGRIAPSTLRLNGRRVSWVRDGSPQVAQVPG